MASSPFFFADEPSLNFPEGSTKHGECLRDQDSGLLGCYLPNCTFAAANTSKMREHLQKDHKMSQIKISSANPTTSRPSRCHASSPSSSERSTPNASPPVSPKSNSTSRSPASRLVQGLPPISQPSNHAPSSPQLVQGPTKTPEKSPPSPKTSSLSSQRVCVHCHQPILNESRWPPLSPAPGLSGIMLGEGSLAQPAFNENHSPLSSPVLGPSGDALSGEPSSPLPLARPSGDASDKGDHHPSPVLPRRSIKDNMQVDKNHPTPSSQMPGQGPLLAQPKSDKNRSPLSPLFSHPSSNNSDPSDCNQVSSSTAKAPHVPTRRSKRQTKPRAPLEEEVSSSSNEAEEDDPDQLKSNEDIHGISAISTVMQKAGLVILSPSWLRDHTTPLLLACQALGCLKGINIQNGITHATRKEEGGHSL